MASSPYQPQHGYPKLAALMSGEKDVAIIRRFDQSNMLSLLSLQSEIVELEKELRLECRVDGSHGLEYAQNFKASREIGTVQYAKLKELREKLKEYNWLRDFKGGNSFLKGQEALTWSETKESAYVCLNPAQKENDIFIDFTINQILRLWHYLIGQHIGTGEVVDEATGHTSYSTARVAKIGSYMAILLASMFPVLTIFALNWAKSTNLRILMAVGFTAVFAIMIVVFSDARRIEIFAATATFAAVEVVFIGTAIPSPQSGT